MATRKSRPSASAKQPAFPVQQADTTEYLGYSKVELAAVVITAGIFAGPYGRVILESTEPSKLASVADTAIDQYEFVLAKIRDRWAV